MGKQIFFVSVVMLGVSCVNKSKMTDQSNFSQEESPGLKAHRLPSAVQINCDIPGFIEVPGNSQLETNDFCVMQFEAKAWKNDGSSQDVAGGEIDDNGCIGENGVCSVFKKIPLYSSWMFRRNHVPASVPRGMPWRSILRNQAIDQCLKLNQVFGVNPKSRLQFNLISNEEWQTIARKILKARRTTG